MTELLPGFAPPLLGRSTFDQVPDSVDHPWRQQYLDQMPLLTGHWAHTQAPQMSGMQEFDFRMFQNDGHHYSHSYPGSQAPVIPQNIGYNHDYLSDMDTGTPSTTGFPEAGDSFSHQQPPRSSYLQPPTKVHRNSAPAQSPRSVHSSVSPRTPLINSPQPMHVEERPPISRSVTAPEQLERKSTASAKHSPSLKRSGTSDDDDDEEYKPNHDTKAQRGRKRHRIPHTAVERRYRENLNAHLDKLRQAVPALAARKGPGGKDGEGVKPSKCEILNGAIEHIGAIDKENAALKNEVNRLRAKLGEMEQWYRTNSR